MAYGSGGRRSIQLSYGRTWPSVSHLLDAVLLADRAPVGTCIALPGREGVLVVHNAERVFRGCITSKHIVQLFDTSDTLADGVATFLSDGFRAGDASPGRCATDALEGHRRIGLEKRGHPGVGRCQAMDSSRFYDAHTHAWPIHADRTAGS